MFFEICITSQSMVHNFIRVPLLYYIECHGYGIRDYFNYNAVQRSVITAVYSKQPPQPSPAHFKNVRHIKILLIYPCKVMWDHLCHL